MGNNAMQKYSDMDDKSLAKAMASSGYFDDKKTSQSLAKILAGREMGFGPVTSLKNIHFVQGSIEVGGQLIASKIRQSEKYDYRIDELTDEQCTITIVDSDGNSIGSVTWDKDRADQAGLSGKDNWKKYSRNMLFNRAISDARRFYCPDVMESGPYTPGEVPAGNNVERAVESAEQPDVDDADYEVVDDREEQNGQPEPDKTDDDDDTDGSTPATDETLSDLRTIAESVAEERGDVDANEIILKYCQANDTEPSDVDEAVAQQIIEDLSDYYEELTSESDGDGEMGDDLPSQEELEDENLPF